MSELAEANEAAVAAAAAPREGEADLQLAALAPASALVQARALGRCELRAGSCLPPACPCVRGTPVRAWVARGPAGLAASAVPQC